MTIVDTYKALVRKIEKQVKFADFFHHQMIEKIIIIIQSLFHNLKTYKLKPDRKVEEAKYQTQNFCKHCTIQYSHNIEY